MGAKAKSAEIGVFEAKTHLSELLERVERGQVVFITKRGKRIAELRPIQRVKTRLTANCGKNAGYRMADDFDEIPEDWKEYT